jgi:membrane associated rhomboid family serine protease
MLGAHFVLYPGSRILTYNFPVFLVRIPAWIFLGLWFLYQLIEASFGLFSAFGDGGGVAFFAHVGGFIFGLLVVRLLARAGQAAPRKQWRSTAQPGGILAATGETRRPSRTCAPTLDRVLSVLS